MENQPQEALQVASGMLDRIPKPSGSPITVDIDASHQIQGMVLGAAYLLKHLHDKYCAQQNNVSNTKTASSGNNGGSTSGGKSKKAKKQDQKNKQQLQDYIAEAIERFLKIVG